MRLIRATEYRRMRWKNGLGETTEIAVHPDGATVDSFDWRISMARVESDGPFSAFDGIDRTISILSGAGLRLSVDGAPTLNLTMATDPYTFPGDRPTTATLLDGCITDLNVMTQRARLCHHVRRISVHGQMARATRAGTVFVLCSAGSVVARSGADQAVLSHLDSACWVGDAATLVLSAEEVGEVFLIELYAR